MIYENVTQFVGDSAGLRQLVTNGKTAESPTILPLSKIRTDGGTQSRAGLNQAKVIEYREVYAECADEGIPHPFPALKVFYDGTDYWLFDGFHRHQAAQGVEVDHAVEIHQGTLRDAVLASCAANRTHGLPRTAEDKRRTVSRMLRDDEWSRWSDRAIAQHCGVSPTFVGKIRAETATVHVDSSDAARLYTRNGHTQTMNTAEIGSVRFSSFECGNCGRLRAVRLTGGAYECRACGNSWPDAQSFMADHHRWMAVQKEKVAFINLECGNCGRLQVVEMDNGTCECRACGQKWQDRRSFAVAHAEWKNKTKTAVLPSHLHELHNKVMLWYCEQRRNNIPGQLELMRSIQQQKSNHELWPEFISAMPLAVDEADLYQVIDHLTEYLQVRTDELTTQYAPIPVLQSTIAGWFVNWWSAQNKLNYINACLRGDGGPAMNDIKTAVKHLTYRQEDVVAALKNLKEVYEDQLRIKPPPAAAWQPSAEPQPGKPLIEAFVEKESLSLEEAAKKVAEALAADNQKVWYALLCKIRKYPYSPNLSTWQVQIHLAKFLLGSTMGDIAAMPDKLAEWGIEVKTL